MLTIVPSRGRPHNVRELFDAFESTCELSRLLVVVDGDDPTLDAYRELELPSVAYVAEVHPTGLGGLGPTLNRFATHHASLDDQPVIGFMGDDHRPRTLGWDHHLAAACADGGIAYGDDQFQSANLPTAVFMDARIIRALGYMVPPTMTHLYLDNFWKELGEALGTLRYLPDVIIEHVHPAAGKAPDDERYAFVNSETMWHRDGVAYQAYMANHFWNDVRKVREALAS